MSDLHFLIKAFGLCSGIKGLMVTFKCKRKIGTQMKIAFLVIKLNKVNITNMHTFRISNEVGRYVH